MEALIVLVNFTVIDKPEVLSGPCVVLDFDGRAL